MERESMCKGKKCFKTGVLWWSIHPTHDMKCLDNNLSSSSEIRAKQDLLCLFLIVIDHRYML